METAAELTAINIFAFIKKLFGLKIVTLIIIIIIIVMFCSICTSVDVIRPSLLTLKTSE